MLSFELLIFIFSGFIHGLLGFGFPMIATPLLSVFLSMKEAVLLTLFPTLVLNGQVARQGGNFTAIWQEYKVLILSVIVGSFIGTNFLIKFDSEYYKLILAFVMLLYLNKEKLNLSLEKIIINNSIVTMAIFGLISGIVSGLVNVMLPILVIYILESKMEKEKSIILMNFCFFSSKLTQIFIFGSTGNFSFDFLLYMIPVVIISLVGLFLGTKIRKKIDENLYTKILRILLLILSIYLIIQVFF